MTGRPEGRGCHVVHLGFGNPRHSRSWGDRIGSGPCGSVAEFAENTVGVVPMAKLKFAELNALGDGSTDAIYLEDQVVSRFVRATGHPGGRGHHVVALRFGNPGGGRRLRG
jgi:hypothetical protein